VDNIHVALLMALAIAFFASLAIAHTLRRRSRLSPHCSAWRTANTGHRCRAFRSMELAMIGQAVGDLGERLAQATEERAVLTRRLLEIRSDERRVLARELHDEFGQNLRPFSPSPASSKRPARSTGREQEREQHQGDVAQDARMISQATHRIMACLRDTLNSPAPSAGEELGLEACLVSLVDSWRSRMRRSR
jgi:glucose-6-phosphate-specific signal transduction histidine kinase